VTTDEAFLEHAQARLWTAMLMLSAGGSVAALVLYGWQWSLGYLAGAIASLANFRWLHQLTASLDGRRPRKRLLVFLLLRYFLLGLGGYVIVKFFGLNLVAALVGLLVAAGAVIFEILYELIYARA
jgi:hypothetical protein